MLYTLINMANTLSAHNTCSILHSLTQLCMQCYIHLNMGNTLSAHHHRVVFDMLVQHAVLSTLIKMANALSAYNTQCILQSLSLIMQCYVHESTWLALMHTTPCSIWHGAFARHAVLYTLINMGNTLSAHNAHVVFYIAFHSACSVIYINKNG